MLIILQILINSAQQMLSTEKNPNQDMVIQSIEQNFKIKVKSLYFTKLSSLTNDVFKVTSQLNPQNNEKKLELIYKFYKNQLSQFINRDSQQFVLQQLSKQNLYPKIYLMNKKERIQQYINGKELTVQTATPQLLQEFVTALARFSKKFTPIFENQKMQKERSRQIKNLWTKFKKIYEQMRQRQPQKVEKCKQFVQRVLFSKIQQILIASFPEQMILSHNDSNLTNIMVKDSGQLQILDFQFSCMNYIGFDIGNFLNQYATQYHDGFEIREEWQIKKEIKEMLIKTYFDQLDYQAQNKMKLVQFGRLLSHLFWMFIGLRQIGDNNGLDMVYYVRKRFQELSKYVKALIGLQI